MANATWNSWRKANLKREGKWILLKERESLLGLKDEAVRLSGRICLRDAKIEQLEQKLDELKNTVARHETENELLTRELELLTRELDIIRKSTVFKLMRKYGPAVDQCFPPGTSRHALLLKVGRKLSILTG